MSKLSHRRGGVPDMTKVYNPAGPKNRDWRKDEPLIVVQPCRVALNAAIADKDFGKVNRIAEKKRLRTYSRLSKPALLNYLRRV